MQALVDSMTDEELQARDEVQVVAKRLKAGALGNKLKRPSQQISGPKQFF